MAKHIACLLNAVGKPRDVGKAEKLAELRSQEAGKLPGHPRGFKYVMFDIKLADYIDLATRATGCASELAATLGLGHRRLLQEGPGDEEAAAPELLPLLPAAADSGPPAAMDATAAPHTEAANPITHEADLLAYYTAAANRRANNTLAARMQWVASMLASNDTLSRAGPTHGQAGHWIRRRQSATAPSSRQATVTPPYNAQAAHMGASSGDTLGVTSVIPSACQSLLDAVAVRVNKVFDLLGSTSLKEAKALSDVLNRTATTGLNVYVAAEYITSNVPWDNIETELAAIRNTAVSGGRCNAACVTLTNDALKIVKNTGITAKSSRPNLNKIGSLFMKFYFEAKDLQQGMCRLQRSTVDTNFRKTDFWEELFLVIRGAIVYGTDAGVKVRLARQPSITMRAWERHTQAWCISPRIT